MDSIVTEQRDAADEAGLGVLASPALDAVFMRPSRIDVPSAWYGHVPFAHWLVAQAAPRTLVELGSHNGVSYAAFCEAVVRTGVPARCTAVDTWQGDEHAGFYGDAVYDDLKRFHDPRFGGFSTLMRCTFDEARGFFADGSLDLLHIDGLHTYEAVRHDWENWRTALSDRAVVLFHDVNERQGSFGVWRLWDELRAGFPSFTFLHSHGLGVLAVGTAAPQAVLALCAAERDPAACSRLRERFAQLGERWDAHFEQSDALRRRREEEARNAGLAGELATAVARMVRAEQDASATVARAGQDAAARVSQAGQDAAAAVALAAELSQRLTRETELALLIRSELEAQVAELRANREEETTDLYAQRDSAWSHVGRLEDEQRRLKADLAQAHADLAQRAEDWERVHRHLAVREAKIEQAQADADAARAHAATIEASTTWQVGAPIRRLGQSVPGLSRTARRTSELARVALSGQLGARRGLRRERAAEIARLRRSPLFDAEFYLRQHPVLAAAGHDPAVHYAWVGRFAGAKPNPYFDSAWYLARNPGVTQNPLLHWEDFGAAQGLDPNPLLQAAWYRARYPDAGPDALLHYLQTGAAEQRDPNPMLDAEAYLIEYADARQSGLDALLHWQQHGAAMDYNPHPLFDTAWYRVRYELPAGVDPLVHWLEAGVPGRPTSALVLRTGSAMSPLRCVAPANPQASIIIPVYGHYADTVRCLYALLNGSGATYGYEVLVVDDHPDRRITPLLERRIPGLRCIENLANLGFLRSCNTAAAQAASDVIVFLNNDTTVHPGWLDSVMAIFERQPKAGMVGCKLLNADGTVQEAGGSIGSDGWGIPYGANDDPAKPEYNFVRDVDVVIGACMAVRRTAWLEVGGFDERYAPAFYEEFDLAFALRDRGWRVIYQPAAAVDHLGSNSYGAVARDRHSTVNHAKFCAKWATVLSHQPSPRAAPFLLRERPHASGTLLFIDDTVPEWNRHSGSLMSRHYIQLWQAMGYKVVFLPATIPTAIQPYTATLQQEGVEVLHAPETLASWIGRNGRFVDVIWTSRPDVTDPILDLLRGRCAAPILYNTVDLHHLRELRRWELERDPRALEESRRYRSMEHRIFAAVDRVLSVSSADAVVIREDVPTADVHVIPLFVYSEPASLPDPASFASRDVLLFVGGYQHLPNVDAARFLVDQVMPLVWEAAPDVVVMLAGSSPPPEVLALAGPGIEVPGFVSDLTPIYARARISISPLRYGAGMKGKVVAALWEGIPVVTTWVGNEGLDLVHARDALIADTPEALAAAVLALWYDQAMCGRLAEAGRRVMSQRFTVEAAKQIMLKLVAAGRRPGTLRARSKPEAVETNDASPRRSGIDDRSVSPAYAEMPGGDAVP